MKELNAVFKDLRAQGFAARQNFQCCSNCAGFAMAEEFGAKMKADPTFTSKGFVYFHKQDAEQVRKGRGNALMLRFGFVTYSEAGKPDREFGMDSAECGKAVVATLCRHGIEHEWSGNANECIRAWPLGRRS